MESKSSFKIVTPPPSEVVVTLNLSMRPNDLDDLFNALRGLGTFGGSWYAIRDAHDELKKKGMI
jgi:hypothetical protein